jgi:hypothetical protein
VWMWLCVGRLLPPRLTLGGGAAVQDGAEKEGSGTRGRECPYRQELKGVALLASLGDAINHWCGGVQWVQEQGRPDVRTAGQTEGPL